MKVCLVFDDWRKIGEPNSIYNTDEGLELSKGDFHSGTVFVAELNFEYEYDQQELEDALAKGYIPVFQIHKD